MSKASRLFKSLNKGKMYAQYDIETGRWIHYYHRKPTLYEYKKLKRFIQRVNK